jgi:hypothetical protein
MGTERHRHFDRDRTFGPVAHRAIVMAKDAAAGRWFDIFTFTRDGISGSELLGMTMVFGLVFLLIFVQLKESGSSKKLDFAWLFLDASTGKVSRSGVMAFGGFLLGCWVVVDAEQSGHLDWSFLGIFLSYCAGVRAMEVFKPKDSTDPPAVQRETTVKETIVTPQQQPDPAPVVTTKKGGKK